MRRDRVVSDSIRMTEPVADHKVLKCRWIMCKSAQERSFGFYGKKE